MKEDLDFQMQDQGPINWCWAAVVASVEKYYDPQTAITKCELANREFGQLTCCADGNSAECNRPAGTADWLGRLGRLRAAVQGPATFDDIVREIRVSRRPIVARIMWSNFGIHAAVISGFEESKKRVLVRDPWYGESWIKHGNFCTAYKGNGEWISTSFTQQAALL